MKKISYQLTEIKLAKKLNISRKEIHVFGKNIIIVAPENVKVKTGLRLNEGAYINATRGNIIIGENVTLSPYSRLVVGGYDLQEFFYHQNRIHFTDGRIEIGNNVWIGTGAIILSPAKITGNNVVVAAGAVVVNEVHENNIVLAGVPAKIVKHY